MLNEPFARLAPETDLATEALRTEHATAWRKTFAAALRVIDHHRAQLEANMTIRRLRRDEQRPAVEAAGRPLGR